MGRVLAIVLIRRQDLFLMVHQDLSLTPFPDMFLNLVQDLVQIILLILLLILLPIPPLILQRRPFGLPEAFPACLCLQMQPEAGEPLGSPASGQNASFRILRRSSSPS
jgi:hypothetical protein